MWGWVALVGAVGLLFFMMYRGHGMGCCGGGHANNSSKSEKSEKEERKKLSCH